MKFLRKFPKSYLNKRVSNKYVKSRIKNSSVVNSLSSSKPREMLYGVRSLEACRLQYFQLESIRKLLLPYTKKVTRVRFSADFSLPVSRKSSGSRMGKGKGKLENWVTLYKKGDLVFEFNKLNDPLELSKMLRLFKFKLPFKFCITKDNINAIPIKK